MGVVISKREIEVYVSSIGILDEKVIHSNYLYEKREKKGSFEKNFFRGKNFKKGSNHVSSKK